MPHNNTVYIVCFWVCLYILLFSLFQLASVVLCRLCTLLSARDETLIAKCSHYVTNIILRQEVCACVRACVCACMCIRFVCDSMGRKTYTGLFLAQDKVVTSTCYFIFIVQLGSIIIIAEPRTASINVMYTKSMSKIIHIIENSIIHLVVGY